MRRNSKQFGVFLLRKLRQTFTSREKEDEEKTEFISCRQTDVHAIHPSILTAAFDSFLITSVCLNINWQKMLPDLWKKIKTNSSGNTMARILHFV